MNPIKENQKIKIIPDKIEKFSMGVITSACKDFFVAEVNNTSQVTAGLDSEILISSEDYMVMFTSKVSKIERNNVFFSIPAKFNIVQKREYPRIDTNLPVLLQEVVENKETEATIINIGGGGMQISSPVKFNSNCLLNARFSLPNKKEINTLFEVLRCDIENNKFLISGKFKTISNFDKTAIVQFCFKRKLEVSGFRTGIEGNRR